MGAGATVCIEYMWLVWFCCLHVTPHLNLARLHLVLQLRVGVLSMWVLDLVLHGIALHIYTTGGRRSAGVLVYQLYR